MIDIRDYIISSEKLPNDSGFIFKPENSYVIEKGSNALLKVKEYSRGIIRCENGICYCNFSSVIDVETLPYNNTFLGIQTLQKSKYYRRKIFLENLK
jgi:hypothetical protein